MSQKQILIHYGELSTKGRNKKMFINKLAEHIRYRTQDLAKAKAGQAGYDSSCCH